MTNQSKKKTVVYNGTTYVATTPRAVIDILEQSRRDRSNYRLVIFYGDRVSGRAWGDIVECFVGRSSGDVKIPLEIYNSRSLGGGAIFDDFIVKIVSAAGKRTLYQHTHYHTGNAIFRGKNAKYAPFNHDQPLQPLGKQVARIKIW